MIRTIFENLEIGQRFFDFSVSGEWMVKVSSDTAEFIGHGVFSKVSPACPVDIEDKEDKLAHLEKLTKEMHEQASFNEFMTRIV